MHTQRLVYGVGVLVLGLGCLLFGTGQLLGGAMSRLVSMLFVIMGVTLAIIGSLVVTDSDRLSEPNLSDTALLLLGGVSAALGLFLGLGSVGLLLSL